MKSAASDVSLLSNVLMPTPRGNVLSTEDLHDWRLRPRRSTRNIWIVAVLSVGFHAALIMLLPKIQQDDSTMTQTTGPLKVTLLPLPLAQRPPTPEPVKPQPQRTVIASSKPSSSMPPVYVPPKPPEPTREPQTAAPPLDFAAAVEARRAQRQAEENYYAQQNAAARAGERVATGAEKADAAFRRNMRGLGQGEGTSGVFQIQSKGSRYASFTFRGWQGDRSNAKMELIEVDAGVGGDVELAIVRRMIALIRTHYSGNFNWESHRLGRVVQLSARPEDTAGLEAFLMREFFG
ncbi:MAG: hypothetical protein ACK5UX_09130 [Burkholderiales bacterium]